MTAYKDAHTIWRGRIGTVYEMARGDGVKSYRFDVNNQMTLSAGDVKKLIAKLMRAVYPRGGYYQRNKAHILAYSHDYHAANKEKRNEKSRERRKAQA